MMNVVVEPHDIIFEEEDRPRYDHGPTTVEGANPGSYRSLLASVGVMSPGPNKLVSYGSTQ